MSTPYWVFDTGALLAYVHGHSAVGQILVDVADVDGTVGVPLICAVEAYSLLHHEEYALLRTLRRHPAVRMFVPATQLDQGDDCPGIGSMAAHTGRLGAGHAAYTALAHAAGVVTSRPDQIRTVLGEKWEVVEV